MERTLSNATCGPAAAPQGAAQRRDGTLEFLRASSERVSTVEVAAE